MSKKEIWIETKDYKIKIEKVPDQSGFKNVIQHTYYLKEGINNDRFPKKNDIQL